MYKRLFWLGVGAIAGFTGSVWLQRRVRETLDRFAPQHVQQGVKAAVAEGRTAMRAREDELRDRYAHRGTRPSPIGRSRAHR